MNNHRQHNLHLSHLHLQQIRVQKEINLVSMDESLLNNTLTLFRIVMVMIYWNVQIWLLENILLCLEPMKIQLMLDPSVCLKNDFAVNNDRESEKKRDICF